MLMYIMQRDLYCSNWTVALPLLRLHFLQIYRDLLVDIPTRGLMKQVPDFIASLPIFRLESELAPTSTFLRFQSAGLRLKIKVVKGKAQVSKVPVHHTNELCTIYAGIRFSICRHNPNEAMGTIDGVLRGLEGNGYIINSAEKNILTSALRNMSQPVAMQLSSEEENVATISCNEIFQIKNVGNNGACLVWICATDDSSAFPITVAQQRLGECQEKNLHPILRNNAKWNGNINQLRSRRQSSEIGNEIAGQGPEVRPKGMSVSAPQGSPCEQNPTETSISTTSRNGTKRSLQYGMASARDGPTKPSETGSRKFHRRSAAILDSGTILTPPAPESTLPYCSGSSCDGTDDDESDAEFEGYSEVP
eukprot:gb/GECG01003767.1/.p1 GENE.gb/GECG01003767.1/~~gb/GECG01003767.1/.p1  ORF type:complete len:363 (+),score=35.59 gb/GECG01003767.1/:1-1089(+)